MKGWGLLSNFLSRNILLYEVFDLEKQQDYTVQLPGHTNARLDKYFTLLSI
jgi:hypothetical protein